MYDVVSAFKPGGVTPGSISQSHPTPQALQVNPEPRAPSALRMAVPGSLILDMFRLEALEWLVTRPRIFPLAPTIPPLWVLSPEPPPIIPTQIFHVPFSNSESCHLQTLRGKCNRGSRRGKKPRESRHWLPRNSNSAPDTTFLLSLSFLYLVNSYTYRTAPSTCYHISDVLFLPHSSGPSPHPCSICFPIIFGIRPNLLNMVSTAHSPP